MDNFHCSIPKEDIICFPGFFSAGKSHDNVTKLIKTKRGKQNGITAGVLFVNFCITGILIMSEFIFT
jgi:hypothetical protein